MPDLLPEQPDLLPEQLAIIKIAARDPKTYYAFDPDSGEFMEEFQSREEFPPDHASITDVPPGTAAPGNVRCFDRLTREWSDVEDYRNTTVYFKLDGSADRWDQLGPLPDYLTALAPATEYDEFIDDAWVTNTARKAFEEALDGDTEFAEMIQKITTLPLADIRTYLTNAVSTQDGARKTIIKLGIILAAVLRR